MQIRPKFIRSQRISRLIGPADGRRDVLRPARFRQWPTTQETTPPASGPRQGLDWVQVDNRERFFSDPAICRLCLTVEAGIGKTTAIEQIAYLRQLRERGHLALTLPFRSLPLDARQYLHSVQGLPPAIVRRLQSVPGNDSLPDDLAARMVRHKIRIGQFTLLVDGLDHWREPAEAQACARALADFLRQQPTMRCVIAGRPYAIQRYWTELFEDTGPWEFVQLDLFREDEQRDFLGPERFEKLRRLEGEALATPRSLDTILRLSIDELAELRTLSDVYWCCVSAMLDKARENSSLAILGSLALKLLALLAFEMSCRGNFAGIHEQRGELDRFLGEVWLARRTDLAADITTGRTSMPNWGRWAL